MTRRRLLAPTAFAAWTLLIWSARVRNVLADDGLGAGPRAGALVRAGAFVCLAVVVAVALVRASRQGRLEVWGRAALWVLVGLTVVLWAVSALDIALDPEHDAGFKVVHAALAVVSVGLAALAAARVGGRAGFTV